MPTPPPLRAVVFDAYGTLFDLGAAGRACAECFGERGAAVHGIWRAKQLEYAYLLTILGRYRDFWDVTRRALDHAVDQVGVALDDAGREQLLGAYSHPALYPEVRHALDALAPLPRLLLSNGSPAMLRVALEAHALTDVFAAVLSADSCRAFKPSAAVYELARAAVGAAPDAIAFVSANGFDVSGAKAFGFHTVWVNRAGGAPETIELPPDVTIADLGELADRLGLR